MLVTALIITSILFAQPKTDTTKANGLTGGGNVPQRPAGPKPYKEVITDKTKTTEGLFKVHKLDDKYFFEIPDSLLSRDILVVNRISKAAAGMRNGFFGYAGDQIGQNVVRFEKGPNNKVFLRNISYAEYAKDSTSPMFTAVNNSNIQPIAAAFDIKAFSKDSTGSVIDITDYINGDNDVLHFNSALKNAIRVGPLQPDKSYIENVRSFPINVEITTVKTYARTPAVPGQGGFGAQGGGAQSGNLTVELNSSMVLLPKVPMQSRYFDKRIGYFTVGYTDYDANPQGVETISLIKRWRLEPKDEDIEKYKRGELVEPKKQIVFYIDPATPKKWIPYLIKGVNDWEPAFEKAGFKNAIVAKMAPTKQENPDWSLEDARFSAIVYKPSDIANASGPSISDPRSGEIMESHINWYHNVMELIHNWYMIQAAPSDERARKMTYDDELMGQLIRFVSSHEVGHTLGLRHNFGSSSSVPVENLRNKAWVEANGHTPSIMDYARFNYVAQPEDHISEIGLFPRIGDYDRWAIQWGYTLFPQFKNAEAEKAHINKWVIDNLKNHRLWWGDGESNQDDPRSQTEDLGDDAVKASMYGIKNLQRIVPNLMSWTKQDDRDYTSLSDMYREVAIQFNRYMVHVARNVGGIYLTPKMVEESGAVYEFEPKAKQKEAAAFINSQLFNTPSWLIDNSIYDRIGGSPVTTIGNIQDNVLNRLFSSNTLNKFVQNEAETGAQSYSITELFSDLKKGIWSELATKKKIDVYRRNLQKSYIGILNGILNPPKTDISITIGGFVGIAPVNTDKSDIKSVVRAHLVALRNEIKASSASIPDEMSRYHLQDVLNRIDNALNPKN
jgi:hypothetical protein